MIEISIITNLSTKHMNLAFDWYYRAIIMMRKRYKDDKYFITSWRWNIY